MTSDTRAAGPAPAAAAPGPLPAPPAMQPWLEYWESWTKRNQEGLQALAAGLPPKMDMAAWRGEWLQTLSRSLDAHLRSPAFLEAMRRNLEAVTAAKSNFDAGQREVARQSGMPHAEDLSGLFVRMESSHEAMLAQLRALDQRLARLEQAVLALAASAAGPSPPSASSATHMGESI